MARYDFQCSSCGARFEAVLPTGTPFDEVVCPRGHRTIRRIFTPPAIVFKGPGWYVTDSRKPENSPAKAGVG